MRTHFTIPVFLATAGHLFSEAISHDSSNSLQKRSGVHKTTECPQDQQKTCVTVGLRCEIVDSEPACVDRHVKKCNRNVEGKCLKLLRECDERKGTVFCTDREHDECSKTLRKPCLTAKLDCVVINDESYCADTTSTNCSDATVKKCHELGKKCEAVNEMSVCTDRTLSECTDEAIEKCKSLKKKCEEMKKKTPAKGHSSAECSGDKKKTCERLIKTCPVPKNASIPEDCTKEKCLQTCQRLYAEEELESSECQNNTCHCNGMRACTVPDCEAACRKTKPGTQLLMAVCTGKRNCKCRFVEVIREVIRYKCSKNGTKKNA